MKFNNTTGKFEKTTTELVKEHIKNAKVARDSLPDYDLHSWHFFNGQVTGLQNLLHVLVHGETAGSGGNGK